MLNGKLFKTLSNGFGVPQGSTLDPLLILIYVNDMANAVQNTPRISSDDTCLLISHNSICTQDNFNTEVKKVRDWCTANTLTIDPSKNHTHW